MSKIKVFSIASKRKKRVAIIGTAGIPANYGGFETLAEYLVENLSQDIDFIVYCSSTNYPVRHKFYKGAQLRYLPISANGKWSLVYDSLCVIHSLFYVDTLLILGVGGAFILPLVKLFSSKKIVTNIDGLEWKRNKWGSLAKSYLYIQEYIAVKFSHTIIADNKGISEYVNSRYGVGCSLIAYGGSHTFHSLLKNETIEKYNITLPYGFTVCRIEPENNVHLILEAFSKTDKNLIFIGNWDASIYGRNLKKKYREFSNINIIDPIYDQNLLNEIRSNCDLYVHGHSAGGTNPSLVEAMWLGLPIFAWDVNYNRYTTSNAALFFSSADQLIDLLSDTSKDQIDAMRDKVKKIAHAEYSWSKIAHSYQSLF